MENPSARRANRVRALIEELGFEVERRGECFLISQPNKKRYRFAYIGISHVPVNREKALRYIEEVVGTP